MLKYPLQVFGNESIVSYEEKECKCANMKMIIINFSWNPHLLLVEIMKK